jgi:hypothetical protein
MQDLFAAFRAHGIKVTTDGIRTLLHSNRGIMALDLGPICSTNRHTYCCMVAGIAFADTLRAAKYVRGLCMKDECWQCASADESFYCSFHLQKCETCGDEINEGEIKLTCSDCAAAMFCSIKCMFAHSNCGSASSL